MTTQDHISSCLSPLRRLTHLHILIHCDCYSDSTDPAPYSESFVDSVQNFDFEGTVARLASAVPSLSVVILTSTGIMQDRDQRNRYWITKQKWSETRGWRITSGVGNNRQTSQGAGASIVELGSQCVADIILREELEASERSKVSCLIAGLSICEAD